MAHADPATPSRLRAALARCRGGFIALLGLSAALNLLAFAAPLFSLQVFDRVLSSRSGTTLALLLALTLFLLLLYAVVEGIRSRLLVRLGVLFDDAAAPAAFDAMAAAGIANPRDTAVAETTRDLDAVREGLAGQPALALLDLPWVPLYLLACFLLHPWLGWAVLGCGLLLAALAWANDRATTHALNRAHGQSLLAADRARAAHRQAGMLRSLGMLGRSRERWAGARDAMLGWQALASDRAGLVAAAAKLVRFAAPVLATAVGGALAISGEITPGTLVAAALIAARALVPIDMATSGWKGLQAARAAWARLLELERRHPPAPARTPLPPPTGRVEVSRLVVVPEGGGKPALRGVSFALEAGEVLGVVGPSGSGKSTLARALVGAAAPLAGEVRLDGARLDQWDAAALAPHLGYLPQDGGLVAGTVAENIARLDPDPPDGAVVAAAKAAGAHELVLALPEGYETRLGDGGRGLSGGQAQRVALARALYGEPALLVLDEPNAALDADGEAALRAALADLKARGATVVLVTHRTGVLAAADKLLVLEEGNVRAFGPRDSVIATLNGAGEPARPRPALVQGGKS